jgi:sugar lactone lactonase YvrE
MTEPGYGSLGNFEGHRGELFLKEAVCRIDPAGTVSIVTDEILTPNGLCFSPVGQRIGQIVLPETFSNVCFGGPGRNWLFMTASRSLSAVYSKAQGRSGAESLPRTRDGNLPRLD